jgi:hypothetical protein
MAREKGEHGIGRTSFITRSSRTMTAMRSTDCADEDPGTTRIVFFHGVRDASVASPQPA